MPYGSSRLDTDYAVCLCGISMEHPRERSRSREIPATRSVGTQTDMTVPRDEILRIGLVRFRLREGLHGIVAALELLFNAADMALTAVQQRLQAQQQLEQNQDVPR